MSALGAAGLEDIRVSDAPPYWHAVGRKPGLAPDSFAHEAYRGPTPRPERHVSAGRTMKRIFATGTGGAASATFIASLHLSSEPYYVVGADSQPLPPSSRRRSSPLCVPPATDPATSTHSIGSSRPTASVRSSSPDHEVPALSEQGVGVESFDELVAILEG